MIVLSRKIRRLLFSILLIQLFPLVSAAQRSEVGFGLGTFNYTGDLVKSYDFRFSKPAATIMYPTNLSRVVSLRTSITGGQLGASALRNPVDAFAGQRAASFNIFLLE